MCRRYLLFVILASAWRPAAAATVQAEASSQEVYLNEAFTLRVDIVNAADWSAPEMKDLPGFAVKLLTPTPRQSQYTSIVNGRVTRQVTISYHYQLIPDKTGRLTIPPIAVRADGEVLHTSAIDIVVSKSETGDLLFVDLAAKEQEVYVGERVNLTLTIWLRPFRQGRYMLSEKDMWGRIDQQATDWGIFLDDLRRGDVTVRREVRKDGQGADHSYFAYRVKHQAWAETAGPFGPGQVKVVVGYPVRLGRSRLSLLNELVIAESRTIVATAAGPDLMVRPIPEQGRPEFYAGAVGRFDFGVTAKPTDVRVGDPITLTIRISGAGRLDTLAPPPLAQLPALTADFKVPDEELAGVIENSTKVFTQSIRARSDRVRSIPAIPFAFFDPDAGAFRTARSKPIEITVKPEVKLDVAKVIQAQQSPFSGLLTEQSAGLLANYTDMDEVLSSQQFTLSWPWAVPVALLPLLYVSAWLVQRRFERLRQDVGLARRRTAGQSALRLLRRARQLHEAPDAYRRVSTALLGYIADRYNLPALPE